MYISCRPHCLAHTNIPAALALGQLLRCLSSEVVAPERRILSRAAIILSVERCLVTLDSAVRRLAQHPISFGLRVRFFAYGPVDEDLLLVEGPASASFGMALQRGLIPPSRQGNTHETRVCLFMVDCLVLYVGNGFPLFYTVIVVDKDAILNGQDVLPVHLIVYNYRELHLITAS
ncbi:hypothetical protein GGR53DRAFT_438099 [Hypoxylon sp. FL1150]|nr:hypothetical protein GGR53DRAFT_438099 [Hypoxylon sp. FL1150]